MLNAACRTSIFIYFSGSNPVKIIKPEDLAGMTLEERLVSFKWDIDFKDFQQSMLNGSHQPICWNAQNSRIAVSYIAIFLINLTFYLWR